VYSFRTDDQFQSFTLDLEIVLAAAAFSFPQFVLVSFEPQVCTSCKTQTNTLNRTDSGHRCSGGILLITPHVTSYSKDRRPRITNAMPMLRQRSSVGGRALNVLHGVYRQDVLLTSLFETKFAQDRENCGEAGEVVHIRGSVRWRRGQTHG